MKKFTKLSLIASSAILGAALLTGCGSNSSDSSASTMKAVDGYIGGPNKMARVWKNGKNDRNISLPKAANGLARGFAVTLASDETLVTPADALLDLNNDGNYSNDGNITIGFEMKTKGSTAVVSHLTSLAVEMNNTALLKSAGAFDPVADLSGELSDEQQKLLVVGELVKTVMKTAGSAKSLQDFNATELLDANVNVSALNLDTATANVSVGTELTKLIAAAKTKAESSKAIVKNLNALREAGIDTASMMVAASDGNSTFAQALTEAISEANVTVDNNITDAINTASADIATADQNITDNVDPDAVQAEDDAIESKDDYTVDPDATTTLGKTLSIGDNNATITSNAFTLKLTTTETSEITDFYSVAFPEATATANSNSTIKVTVANDNNESVCLKVEGANVSTTGVTIPVDATITAKQQNLATLQSIIGTEASTTVTTASEFTGMKIDMTKILENTNTSVINNATDALENFLTAEGNYTVTIEISDFDKLTGTVTVNETSEDSNTTTEDSNTTTEETTTTVFEDKTEATGYSQSMAIIGLSGATVTMKTSGTLPEDVPASSNKTTFYLSIPNLDSDANYIELGIDAASYGNGEDSITYLVTYNNVTYSATIDLSTLVAGSTTEMTAQ
jgi:hypothetical protein